jgi:hypothetical protein
VHCDDSGKKRIFGRKNVRILEKGNQNGEVLSFSECGRRIAIKRLADRKVARIVVV